MESTCAHKDRDGDSERELMNTTKVFFLVNKLIF